MDGSKKYDEEEEKEKKKVVSLYSMLLFAGSDWSKNKIWLNGYVCACVMMNQC